MMKKQLLIYLLMLVPIITMGQNSYQDNIKKAEQGDAEAQYEVGRAYASGKGVVKNEQEAFKWYRKAAEQGHASAEASLGTCYSLGSGVTKDPAQAFYWTLKAAEHGKVFAKYYTAGNYYEGDGCTQDYEKALYWYKQLADNNDLTGNLSKYMIGICYEEGKGVEKDYHQAFYWYNKNTDKTAKCLFRLGRCYDYGMGVSKDADKALHYYREAVAKSKKSYFKLSKKDSIWVNNRIQTLSPKSGSATQVASNKKTTTIQQTQPIHQTTADVDKNIFVNSDTDRNTFAVIIGNEQYKNEANVPYAENDAKVFKEYVQKTLGVPERQIKYVVNGGLNDLRITIRWLKQAMEVCNGQGKAIFYYAGHGIPDEANKTAYLLPIDGIGGDTESGYSLQRLYSELSKMPAQRTMVFLDACFSGTKREGDMMASARGVAIKVKPMTPQGRVIVFAAAQGDETAYPFKSQQHGMFTYYLLKKLQDTNGNVTLGELSNYLTNEVKRESFVENNKMQTPTVNVSAALQRSWRNMKLK